MEPKLTELAPENPEPEITTVVPPEAGPVEGLTPVTSGEVVASSALHAVRSEVPANETTVPEGEAPAAGGGQVTEGDAAAKRGTPTGRAIIAATQKAWRKY